MLVQVVVATESTRIKLWPKPVIENYSRSGGCRLPCECIVMRIIAKHHTADGCIHL